MTDIAGSLKQKAVRGIFTLTFRRLLLKIIDTLGIIYLARLLSQDIFGIFGIISFVVFTFLSFFSDVGLGAALIQKEKVDDDDLQTTFTVQQVMVTALMILAWIFSPYISRFYNLGDQGMWLIRVLSISLFATSFKTVPSIMLERELRFELLVIPEIIETLLYNGIAVFMAFNGFGVWSLVIAVLARTVVGAIVLTIIKPWSMGWKLNKASIKELLHFGVPYQLNSVLALLKDNITPTVIAYWYGPSAVGFVNIAQNIASRPMEISTIVSRITFPTYSRIQGDMTRLKRWIEKSIHLMSVLYFPAILGLMVTARPILEYLYADKSGKWLPALSTLLWFLFAGIPVVITTTYTNALYALGRPKVVLALMVLYTVLTWGIGLPLIRYIGYQGIAITVAIITYITFPFVVRELNKVVQVETFNMVWRPFVATAIMSVFVFGFTKYYVHSLFSLVGSIAVGIVIYGVFLYVLDGKYLKPEIIKVWHTLRG